MTRLADKMSGIYCITNSRTGKMYIGSSKNIEYRLKRHLFELKNNKHHSSKLQQDYNRYKDKSIFEFKVIEETTEDDLLKREQYYIDLYDTFHNGYNCLAKTEGLAFTQKRYSKKKAIEERNLIYKDFLYYYGYHNDCFKIGKEFTWRLLTKHYMANTYKRVIDGILWFVKNYDESKYINYLSVSRGIYYFTVCDENNNAFAMYEWRKGKAINSKYDTDALMAGLIDRGIFDKSKHYIIS